MMRRRHRHARTTAVVIASRVHIHKKLFGRTLKRSYSPHDDADDTDADTDADTSESGPLATWHPSPRDISG